MSRQSILCLLCLLCFTFLFGHQGHQGLEKNETGQERVGPSAQATVKQGDGRPLSWTQWIGSFHLIFLHFPVALIVMTGVSEVLFTWFRRPVFDCASRFMIIAAAVFAVPTAFLGFIYSYKASYAGLLADFIWWHMWAGILTAIFAIFVAFVRERLGISKFYYISLFVLFLLAGITGYLGAGMTFGPCCMYPPL